MSEQTQIDLDNELTALKDKAELLGITYHPSISAAKLKEKIDARLAEQLAAEQAPIAAPKETVAEYRHRMRQEAMKLVRVIVTPMDPLKKEYAGEIFTVGNSVVGMVSRMVPYNNEEGWHVEQIILDTLKEKKVQVFVKKKVNGKEHKEGKLIPAFGIQILDPLSKVELGELAQRQAMAGGNGAE